MKLIITALRGKMAGLIVADEKKRDDVEIIAGIGPKGRDYIGKDIGEVAMIGKTVGAPVVDDIESVIEDADVVCDFSTVELGMEVLDACLKHKKALVVGTTGFSPEQRARLEAAAAEIPIMIAANTDRMVNVMRKLLMDAARELYDDTDIEIIDMHDNTKLDAPSGTARELIESMGEAVGVDLVDDAVRKRQSHLPCSARRRYPVESHGLLFRRRRKTRDHPSLPQLEGLRKRRCQRMQMDGRQTGRSLRHTRVHGTVACINEVQIQRHKDEYRCPDVRSAGCHCGKAPHTGI